jgi:hypothetical protein
MSLKRSVVICFLMSVSLITACKKKPVGPQCDLCDLTPVITANDVLIGCEGNFGWGNASISLYDPQLKTVANSVFSSVNDLPVGDVLQSMSLINGSLYVVVNNSGKIHVLDTSDYSLKQTISGFVSPRYIVGNTDVAFVSDLYGQAVYQIDLTNHTISGQYSINHWTEGLCLDSDKLWVSCPDTNYCVSINLLTNQLEDTVIVGKGATNVVKDKNGKFWSLSTGGFEEEIPQLVRMNSSGSVEQRYFFSSLTDYPGNLTIDSNGEQLYFLNGDCFRMSITASELPGTPFIAANQRIFYGLGISPNTSSGVEIYLADVLDYVQPGTVYRYTANGELIDQFSVGINPQAFWFKP